MKALRIIGVGVLMATAGAAQAQTCPDISGTWKGTCEANDLSRSAKLSLENFGQHADGNVEKVIEITQGSGELACTQVTIDGRYYSVGGVNSKTTVSGEPFVSVGVIESSRWDNEQFAITSAGLIKMKDAEGVFTGKEVYTLDGQNQLKITSKGKVNETIDFSLDCAYSRL